MHTHTHSLVGSDKCNPKLNEMCKWNRSEDGSKMFREALRLNVLHLTCLWGIQVHLSSRQRMHERRPPLSHCLEVVRELDKQMSKGMHLKENQGRVQRSWAGSWRAWSWVRKGKGNRRWDLDVLLEGADNTGPCSSQSGLPHLLQIRILIPGGHVFNRIPSTAILRTIWKKEAGRLARKQLPVSVITV